MTRKLEDYTEFINTLKKNGYRKQIAKNHLEYFIARDIGASIYSIKYFIEGLLKFGFLKDVGIGIFEVCDGWNPNDIIDPKEAKKAGDEVDSLLKGTAKTKGDKDAPR